MSVEATNTAEDAQIETNPLADFTGFQRDLLFAIEHVEEHGSPREEANYHGYDEPTGQCVMEVTNLSGHGPINHGRLYPNLDTLVDNGLVEKGAADRRTNTYKLTDEGEEALAQYRESRKK